jgi:DNA polymerase III subunit delta
MTGTGMSGPTVAAGPPVDAGSPGGPGGPGGPAPAYLVRGSDPSLVAQAAHGLIENLVAGGDPALVVEEFGGPGADSLDVGAVVDACTTPPFLVERRVVVVRDVGQLLAGDAKRLVAYLAEPLPTTALVLVAGAGAVPPSLAKAAAAAGQVVDTSVGVGRARSQWLAGRLKQAPVRLDNASASVLADHLGEDMGRLEGLLATLAAAYGEGATVTAEDLEPFLGAAGSVAPWELTDTIDAGRISRAVGVLHRMLAGPDAHPLRVMAILDNHYRNLLRLDGAGVTSPEEAAQVLGLRSAFPAKKALAQAGRLGSQRIARAVQLLARADLDLRGATGLPGELVLEVLVARLSRLAASGH